MKKQEVIDLLYDLKSDVLQPSYMASYEKNVAMGVVATQSVEETFDRYIDELWRNK